MSTTRRKPVADGSGHAAGRGYAPFVAALLALVAAGLVLLVLCEPDGREASTTTDVAPTAAIEASEGETDGNQDRGRSRAHAAQGPEEQHVADAAPAVSQPGLGSIQGRVVDHVGSPVAGALVRPAPPWGSTWVATDDDGAFHLVDVTPDECVVLWCLHPDLRTGSSAPIDVTPDATTSNVVVEMPAPDPVEIVGRVLDPEGNVLADARTGYGIHVGVTETANVSLGTVFMQLPKDESPAGLLRAAIQARFSMVDRPDGTFRYVVDRTARTITVRANHADFMYAESEYTIFKPQRPRYDLDVVLPPERWVEGRVIDDDDAPVEGVEIRFKSTPDSDSEPLATTDARGDFRFRLDNRDQDAVKAYKTGYVRSTVLLSSAGDDGLVVRVRRAVAWHGHVAFADGTAVSGAAIRATPAGRGNVLGNCIHILPRADSGADGRFSFSNAFELAWIVTIDPGGHSAAGFVPVTLDAVRPSDGPLEIRVEPGLSIEGRVVDDAGRPMVGAAVTCEREDGDGRQRSVRSGDAGHFRVDGLSPGALSVRVAPVERSCGFVAKTFSGVIAGTTGLDLVVARGGSIRGVVVDARGRPVARRGIVAARADRDRFAWAGAPTATTDAHGRFEVTGLEPVLHRLLLDAVFPDQRLRYLEGGEDIAPGTSDLRLVLSYGPTLSVQVLGATGRPLARQEVSVRYRHPSDPAGSNRPTGTAFLRTDAEGRASIGGLHPTQPYDVSVNAPGHVRFSRDGVHAGAAEIRIQLAAAASDE